MDVQSEKKLRPAPVVSLILPCYNEHDVLPETTSRLLKLVGDAVDRGEFAPGSAIYYVDDGSRDGTWDMISEFSRQHAPVCGIKLSRNRGHQNALLCGLMTAPGDVLISLDADLQDDLDAIPRMVQAYRDGNEIVFGVRSARARDTFFKRFTAESYYKLLAFLGVQIVYNHADYRLMSRRAIETLREYEETHLFLRALVLQLGFTSTVVEFERAERFAGESKYPLKKMLALAWQGITSFTAYPLDDHGRRLPRVAGQPRARGVGIIHPRLHRPRAAGLGVGRDPDLLPRRRAIAQPRDHRRIPGQDL